MDTLEAVLEAIINAISGKEHPNSHISQPQQRPFQPTKALREHDLTLIDMLNSVGHEDVSFCVCDPAVQDCPIVFASDGFCKFTGYSRNEIEWRNCRFLQGRDTSKADINRIRSAIQQEKEASVNLLNCTKVGTPFFHEFFLSPLRDNQNQLQYFVGVQCSVQKLGPGQAPANVGWVYAQGLHV